MKRDAGAKRIWYGAVGLAGFCFGLIGKHRPFGDDMLAHPLVVYFAGVAAALLVLRVAIRRPVPEIIPDSALVVGCVVGLAMFLAGNFVAVYALGR